VSDVWCDGWGADEGGAESGVRGNEGEVDLALAYALAFAAHNGETAVLMSSANETLRVGGLGMEYLEYFSRPDWNGGAWPIEDGPNRVAQIDQ